MFVFSFLTNQQNRICPETNSALEGLYRSRSIYCTQCEAEGFRKITYFMDRPDVLSSFTTTVRGQRTKCPVLLSNGNLISSGIEEDDADRHWAKWEDPWPKPCYLFAVVAGDLKFLEDSFTTEPNGKEVTLRIYTEV